MPDIHLVYIKAPKDRCTIALLHLPQLSTHQQHPTQKKVCLCLSVYPVSSCVIPNQGWFPFETFIPAVCHLTAR